MLNQLNDLVGCDVNGCLYLKKSVLDLSLLLAFFLISPSKDSYSFLKSVFEAINFDQNLLPFHYIKHLKN